MTKSQRAKDWQKWKLKLQGDLIHPKYTVLMKNSPFKPDESQQVKDFWRISESDRNRPRETEEYDKADLFFLNRYFPKLIIWKCLSAYIRVQLLVTRYLN